MDLGEKRAAATVADRRLRASIQRLFAAVRRDEIDISIKRQDLELLLAVWQSKKGAPQ